MSTTSPAAIPPPDEASRLATRNRRLGAHGEELAVRHLARAGMVLLDRNWRCPAGEIDLVLRQGRVLVICEVKTRSSLAFGSPLEAVDRAKVDRLRRLAAHWLRAHRATVDDVRIDLVGVIAPHGQRPTIEHVEGVG